MRRSQEYDLMCRLMQRGARIAVDPEVLTHIHLQATGSVSTQKLDATWTRYIALRERIVEHVQRTMPDRDLHPFHQVIFDGIRTLYAYAPQDAEAHYKRIFPRGFTPSRSPATGAGYRVLHRILGFAWANPVRRSLSA